MRVLAILLSSVVILHSAVAADGAAPDNDGIWIAARPAAPKNPALAGLAERLIKDSQTDAGVAKFPIAGCWQDVNDRSHVIRISADRLTDAFNGNLSYFGVQFSSRNDLQTLNLDNWWCLAHRELRVELSQPGTPNAVLRLSTGEMKRTFRPLDKIPETLELKGAPLGKARELSLDQIHKIQADLRERRETDQSVRMGGVQDLVAAKMDKTDGSNTAALKKLIADVGWIDAGRFGIDAETTAILITLHSGEIPLMVAALPHVEEDAVADRVEPVMYAKLYDRLALMLGGKQRFGTQKSVLLMNKSPVSNTTLMPLESPAKVDQFRADIGYPPLSAEEKKQ
jgi:hypothetical protein